MSQLNIRQAICLLLPLVIFCSCHVSYVSFRPEQNVLHSDTAIVTRVYMDRYGDLYPDTAVAIDRNSFRVNGSASSKTLASLARYFLSRPERLEKLRKFYGISADSSAEAIYCEAQRRIRDRYARSIYQTIIELHAGRLVYLVHGFNDTMAEQEYTQLRDTIMHKRYPSDKKPVYVDIHWDGLNAHAFDGSRVAKVWGAALLNSRFVSISLRNLMTAVEQKTMIRTIIITHSLGGGVALGAMFNTTHKWDLLNLITPEKDKERLKSMILSPTPAASLRIGIIAPAIPGESTFIDFNRRGAFVIEPARNNIGRVVIGYNYEDYAVSKQLMDVNLSIIYGSTSLGCNLTVLGRSAIDNVMEDMDKAGYGKNTAIIVPLEFKTPFRTNLPSLEKGTREHAFYYYIKNPVMSDLLDELF